MAIIQNPVLPGFHPDPCLIAQDGWYYIATSTFEWWPGVQLNRSRDLANWEIAGYALTRRSQIDLRGVPDSGGVWAPALSHHRDTFWLVYSNVVSFAGPFKDLRNFLVTAPAIEGPWSDPVDLNRSGFDPSLFHDDDGRTWLLNQNWRPAGDGSAFDGIVIQEYSVAGQKLVGESRKIFAGSHLGTTEGPHLQKKDGFYYLIVAEGGTGWDHAVTVARSRSIFGPYEISPQHPLLTSSGRPDLALQKAGHGSLARTPHGKWFLAHLCARPISGTNRCTLGRETALQAIDWPDGDWPRLANGGRFPSAAIEIEATAARPCFADFHDDFDAHTLSPHWNTLRQPPSPDWLSLETRPGALRLYGRHSLQSHFDQSLIGCRVAHHACDIRTALDFAPQQLQQRAGLALYYNSSNYCYLYVSADDDGRRVARILVCDNGRCHEDRAAALNLPADGRLELQAQLRGASLAFRCRCGAGALHQVGGILDASKLSDDYPFETGAGWAFTGLFAALCAQDSTGDHVPADFDWFHYAEHRFA
jgi:xylan 1,4-beta-xylosidase